MSTTEVTAWVGATTGTLGLALGRWTSWRSHRVRLKVQPQISDRTPAGRHASRFSIRITNLSTFTVTLERVALFVGDKAKPHELELQSLAGEENRLPHELASRTAVVVSMDLRTTIYAATDPFRFVVAETACGARIRNWPFNKFRGKKLSEILEGVPSRRYT